MRSTENVGLRVAYAATSIYWVIVALWLTVLCVVIYHYLRNPRAFGTMRLLLAVIGIDTCRNILENIYFGSYFGASYGVLPGWIADRLGQPEFLILPKVANVVSGCIVLGLLLFHWLPWATREWQTSEQRAQDLQRLAVIDPLTGIYNRRQFEMLARSELMRAQRHGRPLSLLMMDIDFFKRVNDRFGHEVGDWVLKMVATTIATASRGYGAVARIGGEEFVLMLPEANAEAARLVAERICLRVRDKSLTAGNARIAVTISVGVAEATASTPGIEAILRDADRALYQAKRCGRNQVCVASPPPDVASAAAE